MLVNECKEFNRNVIYDYNVYLIILTSVSRMKVKEASITKLISK